MQLPSFRFKKPSFRFSARLIFSSPSFSRIFSLRKRNPNRNLRIMSLTALGLLVLLAPILLFTLFNPGQSKAATITLTTGANSITISITDRYEAVMTTNDTDNYILIKDKDENNASPSTTYEFSSPHISEGGTSYRLRWDNKRRTNILESTPTRVKIRVEGCFDTTGGGACLGDGTTTLTVKEDYVFTPEGIFVTNEANFQSTGITLDADGGAGSHTGYEWLAVYTDVTDAAFDDAVNNTYGDGQTEATIAADGEFTSANKYIVLPSAGSDTYQDTIIGVTRTGWFDANANSLTHEWNWDEDETTAGGTEQDLITIQAQAGGSATTGIHKANWYMLFQPEDNLDTEAERESYNNDFYNPDLPTYTTGSEWDDSTSTPGLMFDNTDDYVNAGSGNPIDDPLNGGGTITAWIYPRSYGESSLGRIVDKSSDTSASNGFALQVDGTGSENTLVLARGFSTSRGIWSAPTGAISLNRWNHVALVYDDSSSSNDPLMYINGVSQTVTETTTPSGSRTTDASQDLIIGNFSTTGTRTFDGIIEEVRLYDTTLTEQQIRETMSQQISPSTSGLVGYWRLNENTGTTTYDETSNNSDGTISGATWTTGFVPDYHNEYESSYTLNLFNNQVKTDLDGGTNVSSLLNGAVTAGASNFTIDSASFPSTGAVYVDGDKVSYTGATATTFTGLTSSGELSIIGHADNTVVSLMNRHSPFFKLRNWRDLSTPQTITLESNVLTEGTDYNLAIKPISSSFFAQDITWSSTFDSETVCDTPEIGSGACTSTSITYAAGKSGMGAVFNASTDVMTIPQSGNIDVSSPAEGTIEFWFRADWPSSTTTTTRNIFAMTNGTTSSFALFFCGSDASCAGGGLGTAGDLIFGAYASGWQTKLTVSSANYSWRSGDWMHIRLTYDDADATNDLRLYINGVEPTHSHTSEGSLNFGGLSLGTTMNWGSATGALLGMIDEPKIYSTNTAITQLSEGGDTGDTDEYLADDSNDYTFDFNDDDANNRGEYVFIGSDSQFQGINSDLSTVGVDSSADFDWEYWNGNNWSALTVNETHAGSSKWTADGNFYWTAPGNWLPYSYNGSPDLYYIRGHLEGGTYSTDPIEDTVKTDITTLHVLKNIAAQDTTLAINETSSDSSSGGDPVAYWRFDEGYGTSSYSTDNEHTITISGATWQQGRTLANSQSTYLFFDGTNDTATTPTHGDFDFGTDSFSITGKFRHPSTQSGTDTILAKFANAGFKLYMDSSGFICFALDDTATWGVLDSACSTTSYADSKWHTFAAVKSGTSSITLYLDGRQVGQDTSLDADTSLSADDTLYIGVDDAGASNYWTGYLDEIAFYHFALSATQVKNNQLGTQVSMAMGENTKDWLTDGLVGWWKMDDNVSGTGQTVADSSGNSLNGTTGGSASVNCNTASKFYFGCDFDGTDDYVSVTENDILDPSNNMTVSAWVKFDSIPASNDAKVVFKHEGVSPWVGYELFYDGDNADQFVFDWVNDSSSYFASYSSTTVSTGTWYHLVGVRDGNNLMLYVNGSSANSTVVSNVTGSLYNTSGPLYIGSQGGSVEVDGVIDEVRVYNRALSPSEVSQLYTWGPGPVVYYSLDENTGTTSVIDRSGNGNTATMTGSMTSADWVPGKFGSALDMDGSNDALTIANASDSFVDFNSSEAFSGSAWVYITTMPGSGNQDAIITKYDQTSTLRGYRLIVENDDADSTGNFQIDIYDESTDQTISATGSNDTVNQNTWYHVGFTFNGGTAGTAGDLKLYTDGTLTGSNSANASFLGLEDIAVDFTIGDYDTTDVVANNTAFAGFIDDIRIYNYMRSSAQVTEDMNGGHPVGGSPIGSQIGYWKFDEGYGDTANDTATTDNDADLGGSGTTCPQSSDSTCPSWTTSGKFNNALDFETANTTDDYVYIANTADLDLAENSQITLSAWVNVESFPTTNNMMNLVGKGYDLTTEAYQLRIADYSDVDYLESGSYDGTNHVAQWQISNWNTSEWHHIVGLYNGTAWQLYFDGKLVNSTNSTSGPEDNSRNFTIGAWDNNGTIQRHFDGQIDEVKVYNTGLTADQVKVDYNRGKAQSIGSTGTTSAGVADNSQDREFCPPGDSTATCTPVLWWPLDENTGTSSINDKSGNGNSATMTGTMTAADWVPGKFSSGLDFDGSNDALTIATASDSFVDFNGSEAFSGSAWVYITTMPGSSNQDAIITKYDQTSTLRGYRLIVENDDADTTGNFQVDIYDESTDQTISATGSNDTVNQNTWYHVEFTFNGGAAGAAGDLRLYTDGILTGSNSANASFLGLEDIAVDFSIGDYDTTDAIANNTAFTGFIDEVRVYGYARSQAQVVWDFNKGAPIGWWKFDECSGTTIYDSAENGNGTSQGNNGSWSGSSGGSNTSIGTCNSSGAWYNGASGKRNASLDFDGSDDVTTITNASPIDFDIGLKTGMTYSAWIYPNSDGEADTGEIFDKGTNTYCRTDSQGTSDLDLECQIDLATTDANLNLADALTTNTWSHIVITYADDADDELTIYVNGINKGSSSAGSGGPATSDSNNFLIGGDSSHNFDGQIDDVQIYNYALTDHQAKLLYNSGAANFGY